MESSLCNIAPENCRLIETFRYGVGVGCVDLDLHLNRMCQSAKAFGYPFDRSAALSLCSDLSAEDDLRCRLTLGRDGGFELTKAPLGPTPAHWRLAMADHVLTSSDVWLKHKSTNRQRYDTDRANLPDGIDELLYVNEKGHLCEGTITNVFVHLEQGDWVTPPLSDGCLPGILRQRKIKTGEVRVASVHKDELHTAREIRVGNALRGEIKANLVGP